MNRIKPLRGSQIDKVHPLGRGLIGCWIFNEGNGIIVDDLSGYHNNGGLLAMSSTDWGASPIGSSLNFLTGSKRVEFGVGPYSELGTNDYTVVSWIKNTSAATEIYISSRDPAGANWWMGTVAGQVWFVSGGGSAKGASATNDGEWHQTVGVHRDGVGYVYVDGVFTGATAVQGDTTTDVGMAIGIFGIGGGFFWEGEVGGAMIYNRALSNIEIKSLYQDPYQMFQEFDYGSVSGPDAIGEVIPTLTAKYPGIEFENKYPTIGTATKTPVIEFSK